MAHKPGRQFFGAEVIGIRTSSRDDAKEGYNLEGREILKSGMEFYGLGFVRAKTLLARVQLTLRIQVNDGRCCDPPPGSVH